MKTVKEMAAVCGVSEQAIRGWCRQNNVAKDAKGKGFAINESTEMAILLHYGVINAKDAKANESSCETFCESNESSYETLKMLEMLQKELEAKDEQIAALQMLLQSTTAALVSAQESVKAAQLLQANTEKKLQLIEQQTDPEEEEPVEPKRKHWWQFGRK